MSELPPTSAVPRPGLDLGALYRAHRGMVQRRLRRFVSEEAAEDLTQEVFERAARHGERFEGRSAPTTWLYQVATRTALHHVRDHANRERLVDLWGQPSWSLPLTATDPETRAFVTQVWRQLDAAEAELGAYHFVDGMSQAEIAQVLGCSRQTIGNRLASLRTRLRDLMEAA